MVSYIDRILSEIDMVQHNLNDLKNYQGTMINYIKYLRKISKNTHTTLQQMFLAQNE